MSEMPEMGEGKRERKRKGKRKRKRTRKRKRKKGKVRVGREPWMGWDKWKFGVNELRWFLAAADQTTKKLVLTIKACPCLWSRATNY